MSNQLTKTDQVKMSLVQMKDQFKAALPPQISVDKFVRVLMTAVSNEPKLADANRHSLYSACMKSAQDGLIPDGKEAALVMFGDSVQYMPMVSGILKKVRNSGELVSITAQLIHKKDHFEFYVDEDGEHLSHKPNIFSDRGELLGVYALAKTKDGGVYIEVMTMTDIEAIKSASRGKNGPWSGKFATEMMKKSAIRRLAKRLPMSTDLESVITSEDEQYDFSEQKSEPITVEAEVSESPKRLKEMLGEPL